MKLPFNNFPRSGPRFPRRPRLMIFLSCTVTLGSLCGQDQAPEVQPEVLPAVEVTAALLPSESLTLPYAVSTVSRDQIQQGTLQLSLEEPLQTIPGVFVLNPYNFTQDSRISFRGFGAWGVRISPISA